MLKKVTSTKKYVDWKFSDKEIKKKKYPQVHLWMIF